VPRFLSKPINKPTNIRNYWQTKAFNPLKVPFYRQFAGLPTSNTGQFLLTGTIRLNQLKLGRWFAAPIKGQSIGWLPLEFYQGYSQLSNPLIIPLKVAF